MFDVLIGTAKGEVHFINGLDGTEMEGFPIKMDSITTQVFTCLCLCVMHLCVVTCTCMCMYILYRGKFSREKILRFLRVDGDSLKYSLWAFCFVI